VQHPGRPSPQAIRSVALHLIRLCLLLEHGLNIARANDAVLAVSQVKSKFVWLTPPQNRGDITVADVHLTTNAEEHVRLVRKWSSSAWAAWKSHHAQIEAWLPAGFVHS
jgi:hypothetical protein